MKNISMNVLAAEIIGWAGAGMILGSYVLTSLEVLSPSATLIIVLNLVGGIGVVVVSYRHRNWQPLAINTIWAIIALVALVR